MKKFYGTTLFLEKRVNFLDSKSSPFEIYVFQDTITKLHVLALVFDSLEIYRNATEINVRVHSSCITSEMLQSLDCDCVQQLNGALEYFAGQKNGILFYLIQEGRGCGYLGKSRACQLTQYDAACTTFDAYKKLGMRDDYRSYHNIREILTIMELAQHPLCLLTNNPDKIQSLRDLDLVILRNISLQFTPNPFNKKYLRSKKDYGHLLDDLDAASYHASFCCPHTSIPPFEIFPIMNSTIFFISSYYLPIQLTRDSHAPIHWLQMSHFYDVSLNCEFIMLESNNAKKMGASKKEPTTHLLGETIFDRLPFYEYKTYQEYLKRIIESNDSLILFPKHNFGINSYEQITKIYYQRAKELGEYISKISVSYLLRCNQAVSCSDCLVLPNVNFDFSKFLGREFYVTGIGVSRYHAMYLEHLFNFKFIEFYQLPTYHFPTNLIIVSQGINPTIYDYIQKYPISLLIHGNGISSEKEKYLKENNQIETLVFESDFIDNTLSRITGVISAFLQIYSLTGKPVEFMQVREMNLRLSSNDCIYVIFTENELAFMGVISNLIRELFSCHIEYTGHVIEFIHGHFQSSLYKYNNKYLLFGKNKQATKLFEIYKCEYFVFDEGNIWDILRYFCKVIIQSKINIEQVNWRGKENQHILYELNLLD